MFKSIKVSYLQLNVDRMSKNIFLVAMLEINSL